MKKALFFVCAIMVMLSLCLTGIAAGEKIMTLDDFELRFEDAAKQSGSYRSITSQNLRSQFDDNNNLELTVRFSDDLELCIISPNQTDYTNRIQLVFRADGDISKALDFIQAVGEIAVATGAIRSIDNTGDLLDEMKLFENMDNYDSGSITRGRMRYSYYIYKPFIVFDVTTR